MARPFYVEHEYPLSWAFLGIGVVTLVLGIIDFTDPKTFDIGMWGFYLLLIAIICLMVGIIMLYSYTKRVREFNRLMKVKSRKEFIAVLDDLEYTAWRLPSKFDAKVAEKKKEFDMK
ncbi:MAG: hypothetical protein A4E32_00608 [Methanomassiliicoccales archaeon PtaU1.Bin124]|nr:MAG: hypothetical protein A4E32_00608 [Methanomassiliicoccales archaeon PtaU1.Bin124]